MSNLKTCDHCEKEIPDDGSDRLEGIEDYQDMVCSACRMLWILSPVGENPKCMACREESDDVLIHGAGGAA